MNRILKEPLVHFVLLGALLFAYDTFQRERTADATGGEIVVSEGRVEHLGALFVKTWQRPPTAQELRRIVDEHVLEEALYREGLALGLDRDDTVIRRRLRQKMDFVVKDLVEQAEPSEADLEAWLAQHPEKFTLPARFRFRQLYLNPKTRGASLRADAESILATLRSPDAPQDPRPLGDPTLLEHAFPDAGADVVAGLFGAAFAGDLEAAVVDEWSGPIESEYGLHVVIVDAREAGRVPELDEVRDAVRTEWGYAQSEAASDRFYAELLERYAVRIEWPSELGDVEASDEPE